MNKRIYLIILLLTCRGATLRAQTNVSGFISSNTTWNLTGSPYIVVGNVLLVHGNTLTIDPGVIVKFNSDKVLQIDGELIAVGNSNSRITFTSNQAIPTAGDWGKVQFADTSVDAIFDTAGNYLSGSIMKYCDVLYGGSLGFGAVHLAISAPYFSNCNIGYSSNDGIYCLQKNFFIDSSSVNNCLNYGISFNCIPYNASAIYIYADTIANNSKCGIYIGTGSCVIQSLTVKNCYFLSNHLLGALYSNSSFQSGAISENIFLNNSTNYLYGSTVFFGGAANYRIDCNRFINNQSGDYGTLALGNYVTASGNYLVNNVFDGNTSTNGAPAISMWSGPPNGIGSSTYIMNNYISNNSSTTSPCFTLTAQYNPADSTFVDHYIVNNEFINNNAPSFFSFGAPANPIASNNFIHLKHNNFLNPLCQYEINNAIPFSSPNIDADSNYWGTASTQHIDSVIYDFFDFGNVSVVYYLPILTSFAPVDTTCPVIIPTSINNIESSLSTLIVFPNPATTHFTVAFNKTINNGILEIYNILGENVLQETIYHTSKKEINLKTISNGIYLVKVFDGERYYCKKIIVEHD